MFDFFKRSEEEDLSNPQPNNDNINKNDTLSLIIKNEKISLKKLHKNLDYTGFSLTNLKNVTNDVFDSLNEQLHAIENVFQEISNYSALTEEVFASTEESKIIANKTLEKAHNGNVAVDNTINSMKNIEISVGTVKDIINELSEKSSQINSMLDIIKNIAKQTKLLSFNASIEAARAGEYGKGFSIVAQEINKLALSSNESAEEISKTILSMEYSIDKSKNAMDLCIDKVNEGTEVSNTTLSTFNSIISAIKESTEISNTINQAVSQQTDSLNNILRSTETLKDHSNKVTSLVEWVGLNTQYTETSLLSLKEVCSNLQQISSKFLEKLNSSLEEETSLNIFLDGNIASLDPIIGLDIISCEVIPSIHSSLLSMNNTGDILPALAKSWTLCDDGVTWTFNLRKGSKFHNMDEVTSEDVKFSLERMLDPKNNCTNAYFITDIEGSQDFINNTSKEVSGIKILNTYSFSITLSKPYSGILTNLAHCCCAIVSKKAYLRNKEIVGCGPFTIETVDIDKKTEKTYIHLKAFKSYFGGIPYIDNMYFRNQYKNLVEEYVNKNIDVIRTDVFEYCIDLQASNKISINKAPILCSYYAGFVFGNNKPWSTNTEVRDAINHAIDRKRIVKEFMNGLATESTGPCPKGLIDSNLKPISYDLTYAKSIFSKYNVLSQEKNLKIAYFNDQGKLPSILIDNLQKLGLKVTATRLPYKEFFNKDTIKQYDLFICSWYADTLNPDSFISALFETNTAFNLGNYSNPHMEELLQKAKAIINPKQKSEAFIKVEKELMSDSPWVYLIYPEMVYASQDYVTGIEVNPLGMISYENVMINK